MSEEGWRPLNDLSKSPPEPFEYAGFPVAPVLAPVLSSSCWTQSRHAVIERGCWLRERSSRPLSVRIDAIRRLSFRFVVDLSSPRSSYSPAWLPPLFRERHSAILPHHVRHLPSEWSPAVHLVYQLYHRSSRRLTTPVEKQRNFIAILVLLLHGCVKRVILLILHVCVEYVITKSLKPRLH